MLLANHTRSFFPELSPLVILWPAHDFIHRLVHDCCSASSRPGGNVTHHAPTTLVMYFTGATNTLYTFGGHAVTVMQLRSYLSSYQAGQRCTC